MLALGKIVASDTQNTKILSCLSNMQKSMDRLVLMYAQKEKIELDETNDFVYVNNIQFNMYVDIIDKYACPNTYKIITDEFLQTAMDSFKEINALTLIADEDKIVWRRHITSFLTTQPEKYISPDTIYFALIKQIMELQKDNLEIIYEYYRDQTLEYVKIVRYHYTKLLDNNKKCEDLIKTMILKKKENMRVMSQNNFSAT
jgi:hypothetical protein